MVDLVHANFDYVVLHAVEVLSHAVVVVSGYGVVHVVNLVHVDLGNVEDLADAEVHVVEDHHALVLVRVEVGYVVKWVHAVVDLGRYQDHVVQEVDHGQKAHVGAH